MKKVIKISNAVIFSLLALLGFSSCKKEEPTDKYGMPTVRYGMPAAVVVDANNQ